MQDIAFLIPVCSYNLPDADIKEQHLYKIFLESLLNAVPEMNIKIYLGYNDDDKVYTNFDNRLAVMAKAVMHKNISFEWLMFDDKYKGKPTHIWNELSKHAIVDGFDYMYACGDDIIFPKDRFWAASMIKKLKKNNNIGIAAGDSGNPNLPMTQFLLHKKHYDIFSWIFPPSIENWGCDNWIQDVYPDKYVLYFPHYRFYNVGGEPRYEVKFSEEFVAALVRRYRPTIVRTISLIK